MTFKVTWLSAVSLLDKSHITIKLPTCEIPEVFTSVYEGEAQLTGHRRHQTLLRFKYGRKERGAKHHFWLLLLHGQMDKITAAYTTKFLYSVQCSKRNLLLRSHFWGFSALKAVVQHGWNCCIYMTNSLSLHTTYRSTYTPIHQQQINNLQNYCHAW